MFKKTIVFAIIALITLSLTACGKYNVDKNLTDEEIAEYEAVIEASLEALMQEDISATSELGVKRELAVSYERIGDYKTAIEYYKEVLMLSPTDYVALNNLVAIYEEVEEMEMAVTYMATLYNNYSETREVVSDAVRIFTTSKKYETAKDVITAYAMYLSELGDVSAEDQAYLSEKYDYIIRYEEKHGN